MLERARMTELGGVLELEAASIRLSVIDDYGVCHVLSCRRDRCFSIMSRLGTRAYYIRFCAY